MNWMFLNPIKDNNWGGMENWMLKLSQGLPSYGDQCLVAGRPHSHWPETCRQQHLPYAPFAFGFDLAPWAIWRLRQICRRYQPDIVVAKGFRAARFMRLAWPSAAIAVKLPIAHDLTDGLIEQWTYGACIDRILVDNHVARAAFLRFPWVLPNKIVAVHNGVALQDPGATPTRRSQVRQSFDLPSDALVVGAAGRLAPDKHFADAIEAFVRIAADTPARLVLFGNGPQQQDLTALAKQRGLADRIIFAGWRNDARELLCGCDVVIHPSRSEGLPNVVLEAMAGGIPVIASDAGGTREIITSDRLGLLIPIGDIAGMSAGLRQLLTTPDLRRQIGAEASRHVRAHFSIATMVERIRATMIEAWKARHSQRMRPLSIGSGRVWVSSSETTIEPAAEAWDRRAEAELISKSGKAVVHRVQSGGGTFYTKRFVADKWFLRRLGIRRPVALLNFRVAFRVTLRGANVVPHLAAWWGSGVKGKSESLLVTGVVPDAITADRWIFSRVFSPGEGRAFVHALATWLAHLHGAGIACHDLKLSNVLVRQAPDGTTDFTLLDLDNCKFRRFGVTGYDARRNLYQLLRSFERKATTANVLRFLVTYRQARRMDRNRLRRLMVAVERRMQRHGAGFTELLAAHRKKNNA